MLLSDHSESTIEDLELPTYSHALDLGLVQFRGCRMEPALFYVNATKVFDVWRHSNEGFETKLFFGFCFGR